MTENNQILVKTISDINQLDGAVSACSSLSDNSQCGDDTSQSDSICSSATENNHSGDETSESDVSDVSWDEEAYSALIRAVLVLVPPSLARIYIAPLSKFKQKSVDHIIDVIFQVKARYGNEESFFFFSGILTNIQKQIFCQPMGHLNK